MSRKHPNSTDPQPAATTDTAPNSGDQGANIDPVSNLEVATPGNPDNAQNLANQEFNRDIEPNPSQQEGKSLEESLAENPEYVKAQEEFNTHPKPAPARDPITGDVIGISPGDTVPAPKDMRVADHDITPKVHEAKGFIRIGNRVVNLASIAVFTLPAPNDLSNTITVTMNNGAKITATGDESHHIMAAMGDCCKDEVSCKTPEDVRKLRAARLKAHGGRHQ